MYHSNQIGDFAVVRVYIFYEQKAYFHQTLS